MIEKNPTPFPILGGVIDRFDQAYPELYWHVAKGKITDGEPLYGAIITTTFGSEIGDGESNISADDAFKIAIEDAGLSMPKDSHVSRLSGDVALRTALEEIIKTNQIREFMGDDKNDGYGDQGWVTRDGQYARIARAALSATATEGE